MAATGLITEIFLACRGWLAANPQRGQVALWGSRMDSLSCLVELFPKPEPRGEIERYTKVTFVLRDEELKTIRVAGLFKAGDVAGLETLRENLNISYDRPGAEKISLEQE